MPNFTPNYNLAQPLVNDPTDADIWGNELNTNFGQLDGLLKTATDRVTVTLTAATTLDATYRNKLVVCNATSAAFTVTLPDATASGIGSGFTLLLKKSDSSANAVTITAPLSQTIDGAATYVLSNQYQDIAVTADGANWLISGVGGITGISSGGTGAGTLAGARTNLGIGSGPSFSNLIVTNSAGNPNTQITITADRIVTLTSTGLATLLAGVNVTINATTNGANGLDTGSLAANTCYYVFVINNGTTAAGFLSTSANPTLPTGYTGIYRVARFFTDGSNVFMRQRQLGNRMNYFPVAGTNTAGFPQVSSGQVGTYSDTALPQTWATVSLSATVPNTAYLVTVQTNNLTSGTTISAQAVASNANYGGRFTANPPQFISGAGAAFINTFDLPLESLNIYSTSTGSTCSIRVVGWVDNI